MAKTVAEIITNFFIDQLKNKGKWIRPYRLPVKPQNLLNKIPYKGINELICAFSDFGSPYYLTRSQIAKLGGRYQGKSTFITFWKINKFEKEDKKTGEMEEKTVPFLRFYEVWNIEQVTGINFEKYIPQTDKDAMIERAAVDPVKKVTELFDAWKDKPTTIHSESVKVPCYVPSIDRVKMPLKKDFFTEEGYFKVLAHEYVHATGNGDRLKRDLSGRFMESESYSFEELVAEIGASMVMSEVGLFNDDEKKNSVAYVNGWIKSLESNPKMILQAASKAEKAVQWIKGIHKDQQEDPTVSDAKGGTVELKQVA